MKNFLLLCPSHIQHCYICYLSCNQSLPKLFLQMSVYDDDGLPRGKTYKRIIQFKGGQSSLSLSVKMEIWKIVMTRSCFSHLADRIGHVIFDLSFLFGGSLMLHFLLFFRDSFIDNLPYFAVPVFSMPVNIQFVCVCVLWRS